MLLFAMKYVEVVAMHITIIPGLKSVFKAGKAAHTLRNTVVHQLKYSLVVPVQISAALLLLYIVIIEGHR